MQKKHILFVCYGLGIGGIEKCLVNLLNHMPENYNIDLLLMNPQYNFKNQIRRKINYINIFDYVMNIEDTITEIKNRGGFIKNIGMLLSYIMFRLRIKMHKNAWVGFKQLPYTYDVAIAYSHHDFSPYYVIDKVKAKKKCMWYHNGAYEQEGVAYERDKKYYSLFDKVVAVSTDCAKVLNEKFNFKDGQLIVLKNICDHTEILEKSTLKKNSTYEHGYFHICTVGRMTAEKGAHLAIEACKILFDKGYKICWHWVGDGNQSSIIKDKIKNYGLEDIFILEGNQNNPYPFIREADIYVQPSLYEAYSTTITEAKILKKPIITTDVGGMRDQLEHNKNGIIVSIEPNAIASAIIMLLENNNLRKTFESELEKEDFNSEKSLIKYENFIFCEELYGSIN